MIEWMEDTATIYDTVAGPFLEEELVENQKSRIPDLYVNQDERSTHPTN